MKKRVLLYAAKFMNIYIDIKNCLENMNYEVVWVEANTIPNNPFNKTLGLYNQKNIEDYMSKAKVKWELLFKEEKINKPFDYFVSIVGIDIPSFAFEKLSKSNQNLRKVLYLYDRVEGVYQIDEFFKFYNEVFSFDKSDCKRFNLSFLPIYWVTSNENDSKILYDIFAFASYSPLKPDRTLLFSRLKQLARENKYKEYIKLYDNSYAQSKMVFFLKNLVKVFLNKSVLTLKDILRGLITGKSVMPEEYRRIINCSRVVFDTQASYQDGLTARFMWALGVGKKIITTNQYVRGYDFYNENQVYVLDDNLSGIDDFLSLPFQQNLSHIEKVKPFRIDNWINTILGNFNQK